MKLARVLMLDERRGATLVFVAFSMFLLLGMAAIAVDLSAAFAWRSEAQKIADSAALAGGSAFMDMEAADAAQPARDRAYAYALQHVIKGEPVDSSEVTVQVLVDEMKVRVAINRTGMPVWFARILGFGDVNIGAVAAAQAVQAGASRCLKPLAVPDAWDDFDNDSDGDNVWEPPEEWEYGSNPSDRYQPYLGPDDPNATLATGYGSNLRDGNGDWGRSVSLKQADPQSAFTPEPGIFLPWRLPLDAGQEECQPGNGGGQGGGGQGGGGQGGGGQGGGGQGGGGQGGGGQGGGGQGGGNEDAGGARYRQNLCTCNNNLVRLGQPYELEPGNMVGPTSQGIDELIGEDPTAYWETSANGGTGGVARPDANAPNGWVEVGMASPRVVKLALFSPDQITSSGMQTITFNNFILMFLEDQPSAQDPVQGRFMYFVGGEEEEGTQNGSLVKYLRLVE